MLFSICSQSQLCSQINKPLWFASKQLLPRPAVNTMLPSVKPPSTRLHAAARAQVAVEKSIE